jgi:CubicO group peptidase (beta-lactamase class C family)
MALLCSITQLAHAQNAPVSAPDVEQRIQHVIAGLTGGVVIKGDEHATLTLANRMKELRVPGVSIAVIHEGKIEWARGFGVRSLGGRPSPPIRCFRPPLSVSRLRPWRLCVWCRKESFRWMPT